LARDELDDQLEELEIRVERLRAQIVAQQAKTQASYAQASYANEPVSHAAPAPAP
jgi:chaperonin cofactor prefoldin